MSRLTAYRGSVDRPRAQSIEVSAQPQQAREAVKRPERSRKRLQKNKPARLLLSEAPAAQNSSEQPLRLPPDLSDAKWIDYLRQSGLMAEDSSPESTLHDIPRISCETVTDSTKQDKPSEKQSEPRVFPEFSHLAVSQDTVPRLLSDGLTPTSSPTSSLATASSMRRQAKTPVYTIGQLENRSQYFGRDKATADKVSSVDLIAAQYQALLGPRDDDSVYSETQSEPSLLRPGNTVKGSRDSYQLSSSTPRSDAFASVTSPSQQLPRDWQARSPTTSDNDTLIGFDDEAIYFKPLSFCSSAPLSSEHVNLSPEPLRLRQAEPALPGEGGSIGLQLCTELLTRELSTAMLNKPGPGSDASALQILVMIEAYERLKEQSCEVMKYEPENVRTVEVMFDSWLRALYSLYDSLADGKKSRADVPWGAGLEAEDVD